MLSNITVDGQTLYVFKQVYIKHSGALIERMAAAGVDVVSLDWTVDMAEGRERVNNGPKAAGIEEPGRVPGNLDPSGV